MDARSEALQRIAAINGISVGEVEDAVRSVERRLDRDAEARKTMGLLAALSGIVATVSLGPSPFSQRKPKSRRLPPNTLDAPAPKAVRDALGTGPRIKPLPEWKGKRRLTRRERKQARKVGAR
jgi:hypothetical protein